MDTVGRIADDLDLTEREMLAVCKLAGVPAAPSPAWSSL